MDGYEVAEHLRQSPKLKEMRLIAIHRILTIASGSRFAKSVAAPLHRRLEFSIGANQKHAH